MVKIPDTDTMTTDLKASSPRKKVKSKNNKTIKKIIENDSDTKLNSSKNEETSKSSQKPQLKIVRNNLGSLVILFFGVLLDLVLLLLSYLLLFFR